MRGRRIKIKQTNREIYAGRIKKEEDMIKKQKKDKKEYGINSVYLFSVIISYIRNV